MSSIRSKLSTFVRLLKHDRRRLLRALTGNVVRYRVFAAPLDSIAAPSPREGRCFRQPTESELDEFLSRQETPKLRLNRAGHLDHTSAYGVFEDGRLVHLGWLLTPEQDERLPVRLLRLAPSEAEIMGSFTIAAHRGRGIYAFSIRCLAQRARELGLKRLLMATRADNVASQRGIEKAGLRRCGTILRFTLPLMPSGPRLYLRRFRRT